MNVALVWAGNPENPMDDRRSTTLATFDPILNDGELRRALNFFSFQVGPRAVDLQDTPYRNLLEDLSPHLCDASDTAAALTHIDLVVTVDTFVAHLAATLGLPVWLLLAFAPDWRWLLDREDSPWYPSVRIFRQSAAGDWVGVVIRLRNALLKLVQGLSHSERPGELRHFDP